jgi:hypothetical protein
MAEKKIVDLVVKDNLQETEGHLKDLSGQIKTSQKDVKSFEQSAESLGDAMINLDASFEEVYGDLKPLTARMGEAEDRLYELALAGKQGTVEFNALLKSVGNYRKTQIQTDLAVDAAATTMTQKLGGSLEFVSGAFASTQGAIALFGKENKSVEQAILKVQSALAITQGFAAMREGANSVRQLGTAIKSLTVFQTAYNFINNATSTGLKVLRGALISTGIGALVVAVGLLIANFDKLKAMALKLVPGLATVGNAIGNIVNAVTDFVGITSEAGRATEKMLENADKSLKKNAKFLKENASVTDQFTKQKIEAVNSYNEALKEDGANQVKLAKELNRTLAKIDAERAAADAAKAKTIQDAKNQKAKEQRDKEAAARQAEADKFNERLQQEGEALNARFEEELRLRQVFERGKAKIIQKSAEESQAQTNSIVKNAMDKSLEDSKNYTENQLALAQAESDGKRALLAITAQALGQFSELLGRQTAEGKALAVAQATINAYLAISEVWKAPNPYPEPFGTATKVASTVVVGAAAFKSISDILAVQVPGGGGGGGSAAAPPVTPRFNVVGASPASANQIANTIGSDLPVVKAYVVANDVTSAQSLSRNIVSSASLG